MTKTGVAGKEKKKLQLKTPFPSHFFIVASHFRHTFRALFWLNRAIYPRSVTLILKKHPEITNEMAPPNYKKKLFRFEGKLIALDEPILPEIETFETKLRREQLYFSAINPPENQELLIERGKTKESTIGDVKSATGDVTTKKRKKPKKESTKESMRTQEPVFSASLNVSELQALEIDLITYLRSDLEGKTEKNFLEVFLRGLYPVKPMQPQQKISYETWRRRDRKYNTVWHQLKQKVFNETGLKFPRWESEAPRN